MDLTLQQQGFSNQQDLFKALTTNNFGQIGADSATGGAALIPQSLENTLRTLTFNEQHCKLWKDINKTKAFSTVEEYNTVDSYGEDVGGFQPEGIAGTDTTSNYQRNYAKIKCLNTTRSTTDLMRLVNTVEDPEALETRNGIRWIMQQAERGLFYGDSSLAPGGEGLEWDGFFKQTDKDNQVDLRGEYLTDIALENASTLILDNYGIPNRAYMPIPVAKAFSQQYYPDQRALMNVQPGTITAGTVVTQFNSLGGTIDLEPNVFMRRGLIALNPKSTALGEEPPTAPTLRIAENEEETGATFETGTYKYAVVAVSSKGTSAPVESDAVTVASKDKGVKLTIVNAEQQIHPAEYFIIFRTEKDGGKFYEIARVAASKQDASAETEFIDKNEVLPNTAQAIVGDFSDENITFRQLAPIFKLDYAIVGPKKSFGIFLYGVPIMYTPKKFVTIKNIKVK